MGPPPFLLVGVIEQHLDTWSPKQPEIVRKIKKNLYVDDLISGGRTVSKAREMKHAATEILKPIRLQMFAKQQLRTLPSGESSLLGLMWEKLRDFLSITVPTEKADKIARIYDPLRVASPLTLCGKLLYRDACNLRIG